MCASFFYSLNLSLGNFLSKFKGKIKDVSFTPKGLTPPSPNVSFLGYPLPPPLGRRLLWMVPMFLMKREEPAEDAPTLTGCNYDALYLTFLKTSNLYL